MARFDCVCFDLDGTLCDSKPGILNGFRYMFEHMDCAVPSDTELLEFIGLSLDKSLAKHTNFSQEEIEVGIRTFREYYSDKGLFEGELYEGVTDAIKRITSAGIHVFLVTAKPQLFAEKILTHFELRAFFKGIYGLDPENTYPGKAIHLTKIKNKYNYTSMVMVGDRHLDIDAANDIDIKSIGVTYGYGSKKELEDSSPTFLVNSVKEIMPILF